MASAEQNACFNMAASAILGVAIQPVAAIDVIFLAASFGWWELRRDTWLHQYNVVREEFEDGGLTISIYRCTDSWVADLQSAILDDLCNLGDDACTFRFSLGTPGA